MDWLYPPADWPNPPADKASLPADYASPFGPYIFFFIFFFFVIYLLFVSRESFYHHNQRNKLPILWSYVDLLNYPSLQLVNQLGKILLAWWDERGIRWDWSHLTSDKICRPTPSAPPDLLNVPNFTQPLFQVKQNSRQIERKFCLNLNRRKLL